MQSLIYNESFFAILISPTPSIFDAIIGVPFHLYFEYLNLYILFKSTSFLLFNVLLFGLKEHLNNQVLFLLLFSYYIRFILLNNLKIISNINIKYEIKNVNK